ncbi:hypothetical protein Nepgr_020301 [Nepenthes gracilis]|uniref:Uncharacterized protein n=1 Tax=Nepenthes gracilis TaxID=150966 RepID=A0AAD3SWL0_NEPGR|nr:hypothetical protein Nepgr_020301 [Nepenthes gracilis]
MRKASTAYGAGVRLGSFVHLKDLSDSGASCSAKHAVASLTSEAINDKDQQIQKKQILGSGEAISCCAGLVRTPDNMLQDADGSHIMNNFLVSCASQKPDCGAHDPALKNDTIEVNLAMIQDNNHIEKGDLSPPKVASALRPAKSTGLKAILQKPKEPKRKSSPSSTPHD